MATFPFSMTTWGSPSSPKRALLVHSALASGLVWFKVAQHLVAAGYRVDAPDLPGHGWIERRSTYTVKDMAQYLADHLEEGYDLIASVSFGSTVVCSLLPLLNSKPRRLVLVDPVLDMVPYSPEQIAQMISQTAKPVSEEDLQRKNPAWTKQDAIVKRLASVSCDPTVIGQLFEEASRGECSHDVLPPASDTEIIILAADPALNSVYSTMSHAKLLEGTHPHVKLAIQRQASHDMHKDHPEVIAGVMLHGLVEREGLEILRG